MARIAWAFFAAMVLAVHVGSVPVPDAGDLVVTTTDAPTTVESEATSAATDASSTTTEVAEKLPSPKIYSMHITSDIEFRFAKTLVTSRVANPANSSQEVSFSVVLPQDAFITGFVMDIDGKSYRAYVKEKEEAKKTYNDAVQQGLSAAHVAYSARESNSFDVSVNIEPLKKITFNLTYEELLKRSKGLYHHTVTISPGQVVPDMLVKVHIKEPRTITKLYTPKFSSENKVSDVEDDPCSGDSTNSSVCTLGNEVARKTNISPTEATVEFSPTLEEQKKLSVDKGKGLSGQFEVLYDVERDPSGGEVLVKDGYFVHFFAPTDLQILPKHIVFVLDISGSMMGRKIEQVKEAMNTILASLQPEDYFNVIVFSSEVTSWDLDNPGNDLVSDRDPFYYGGFGGSSTTTTAKPVEREAVPAYPANKNNIEKALKRISDTEANGGTNIYGGLKQGIKTIKQHRELLKKNGDLKARKSIIMFLTDGEANVGESRPDYIISGLSELNTAPQAPIYSLTFGEDGNIDFLKKLSLANSGLARIIYEGADADIQLKRFYLDISSPLLSNITFKYLPSEVDLNSTTNVNYHTYYQGGELVVAGRTADKGAQEISADVSAAAKDIDSKTYAVKSLPYQGPELTYLDDFILVPPRENTKTRPTTSLERAWAYLTVKQFIDEWEAEKSKKHDSLPENSFGLPSLPVAVSPLFPPIAAPSTTEAPVTTAKAAEVSSTTAAPAPEKHSAKQRALNLALKYSFVTKLTSLVVVKPNATQATEAKRIVSGENGGFIGGAGAYGHAAGLSGAPGVPLAGFLAPQAAASYPVPHAPLHKVASGGMGASAGGFSFYSAQLPPAPSFSGVPSVANSRPMFALPGGVSGPRWPTAASGASWPTAASGASWPTAASGASWPGAASRPAGGFGAASVMSGIHSSALFPGGIGGPLPMPYNSLSLSEASVDSFDSDITTTAAMITTMPPSLEKLNISDVAWLTQEDLNNGTVELDVNGQKKQYTILLNPDSSNSTSAPRCGAPGISSGTCRHLSQCVLRAVTPSVQDYLPYQCQLENYLAICCDETQ